MEPREPITTPNRCHVVWLTPHSASSSNPIVCVLKSLWGFSWLWRSSNCRHKEVVSKELNSMRFVACVRDSVVVSLLDCQPWGLHSNLCRDRNLFRNVYCICASSDMNAQNIKPTVDGKLQRYSLLRGGLITCILTLSLKSEVANNSYPWLFTCIKISLMDPTSSARLCGFTTSSVKSPPYTT